MYFINQNAKRIVKMEEKTFSELGFKERTDLQEWLAHNPESLGEDLLIIQKEFSGFDDTNERLDLLALDKQGNLVIIENKLDDSGKDVTWQSLKYASYCSTFTKEQVIKIYQDYLKNTDKNAEDNLLEFFGLTDISEVVINSGSKQRIILVAGNFRKEVTSTVLWLMNYNLRIQCFKVKVLEHNEQLYLEINQIIPVKEAEEYQIKIAEKSQKEIIQQETTKAIGSLYREFWVSLLAQMNAKSELFKDVLPVEKTNIGISSVISSAATFNFGISTKKRCARVELFIKTPTIYNSLLPMREEIEVLFGDKLVWENVLKKDCKIKFEKEAVEFENKANWNSNIEFMTETMIRFYNSFQPFLLRLKAEK